jgi:hypothetical protein
LGHKLSVSFGEDMLIKGFKNSGVILRKYYAAMRVTLKTKGRPDIWLLLCLVARINYLFSFSKKSRISTKPLFYRLPFQKGPDFYYNPY